MINNVDVCECVICTQQTYDLISTLYVCACIENTSSIEIDKFNIRSCITQHDIDIDTHTHTHISIKSNVAA